MHVESSCYPAVRLDSFHFGFSKVGNVPLDPEERGVLPEQGPRLAEWTVIQVNSRGSQVPDFHTSTVNVTVNLGLQEGRGLTLY